jgi:hypothetical protein
LDEILIFHLFDNSVIFINFDIDETVHANRVQMHVDQLAHTCGRIYVCS